MTSSIFRSVIFLGDAWSSHLSKIATNPWEQTVDITFEDGRTLKSVTVKRCRYCEDTDIHPSRIVDIVLSKS
jgi:hypothetical protein